jgi:hypothetical protein
MLVHKCNCENPLVPGIVEVIDIVDETPDVKSFFVKSENGVPFDVMPGQLAMVSLMQVGEGMFSVSWQEGQEYLQFAIKRVGLMTDELHRIDIGQKLGVRGPYGNGFPVEECRGKDMLSSAAQFPCGHLLNTVLNTGKITARLRYYTAAGAMRICALKKNCLTCGPKKRILRCTLLLIMQKKTGMDMWGLFLLIWKS